jgi:hypothetical protein
MQQQKQLPLLKEQLFSYTDDRNSSVRVQEQLHPAAKIALPATRTFTSAKENSSICYRDNFTCYGKGSANYRNNCTFYSSTFRRNTATRTALLLQ